MEKRLREVEALPGLESSRVLGLPEGGEGVGFDADDMDGEIDESAAGGGILSGDEDPD